MAHDLAPTPRVGLQVQLCGDAHLANVGGYASPERDLVFDLNDFDETLAGPVRVGREAPRHELRDLRARPQLHQGAEGQDRAARRSRVPRVDAQARSDAEPPGLVRAPRRRDDRTGDQGAGRRRSRRGSRGGRREGANEGQHEGVCEAYGGRRRRAEDRLRSAADHADQRPRRPGACRDGRSRAARGLSQLPPDAPARSPTPARGVPVGRLRAQGRRRRQRGDALLDPADARPGRDRSAVPPGQGGAGFRARAVPRQERVREPRPARGHRSAT